MSYATMLDGSYHSTVAMPEQYVPDTDEDADHALYEDPVGEEE